MYYNVGINSVVKEHFFLERSKMEKEQTLILGISGEIVNS